MALDETFPPATSFRRLCQAVDGALNTRAAEAAVELQRLEISPRAIWLAPSRAGKVEDGEQYFQVACGELEALNHPEREVPLFEQLGFDNRLVVSPRSTRCIPWRGAWRITACETLAHQELPQI